MISRPLAAYIITIALVGRAEAQRAEADVEFERGRTLMADGKVAEACAAFEASMKLDPQRGTLYNLGLCHEKLGKIATAWAELDELSRTDNNEARGKDAGKHAAALLPRLPKMRLTIAKRAEGLVITRDHVDVTALANKESPIDPGKYTFEATAPGRRHFISDISFDEGKTTDVEIPELEHDDGGSGTPGGGIDPNAFPIELPRRPILVPHDMVEATARGSILVGDPNVFDRTGIDAGASARAHLGPFEEAVLVGFHVRSPFLANKPNPWDTIGMSVRYPIEPGLVVGIAYIEVQPIRDNLRGSDISANVERKLLLFPKVAVDGTAGVIGSQRANDGNAFVLFGDGRVQAYVAGGLSVEGRATLDLNLGGELYKYTVGLTAAALALYAITPRFDVFAEAASSLLPNSAFQTYTFGASWRNR
jgi:hypothetical protein